MESSKEGFGDLDEEETGYSEPRRSIMSVCSERFTLMRRLPDFLAKLSMREVLPTPGGPSMRMGFYN